MSGILTPFARIVFISAAIILGEPLCGMESRENSEDSKFHMSFGKANGDSYEGVPKFTQPNNIAQVSQMIKHECPCCKCYRYFPSLEFLIDRAANLSKEEEAKLVREVTNYVGEITPGRYCRFCGANVTGE